MSRNTSRVCFRLRSLIEKQIQLILFHCYSKGLLQHNLWVTSKISWRHIGEGNGHLTVVTRLLVGKALWPSPWSSLSGEHHVSPNPLLQYSFMHTASCNQVVFNSCKLNAQWVYQLNYHLVQLCLMRQSGCINISWYDTNWPVVWETQCESA